MPLFVLGYCSLGAYRQFNPTFMMTPLDAHVFEHCGRGGWRDSDCNLIPLFFRSGEERDVIVHQLARYRHSLISSDDNQPVGENVEQDSTDYFAGPTGFMSFACWYELTIDMRFDDAGKLQEAMGDKSTARL